MQELKRFRAARISSQRAGIGATFDGPARALECAVSLSRVLRGKGIDHRMGVHTGEISREVGILKGTAMDIASDVAKHAGNAEILVSRTVHDLVRNNFV